MVLKANNDLAPQNLCRRESAMGLRCESLRKIKIWAKLQLLNKLVLLHCRIPVIPKPWSGCEGLPGSLQAVLKAQKRGNHNLSNKITLQSVTSPKSKVPQAAQGHRMSSPVS